MKKVAFLALFLVSSANVYVHAARLGEMNVTGAFGSNSIYNNINLMWREGYDGELDEYDLFGPVFHYDIGVIKTVSPKTQAFDDFASLLTNGNDDLIGHNSDGYPESYWINYFVESYGSDFYGYEITEITQTINNISFVSPGRNPNGNGVWTDCTYDITYEFNGEVVPEPATLVMLSMGGLALLKRRS